MIEIAHVKDATADVLDPASFASDPAWLSLPIDRRQAALRRLEAISWFKTQDKQVVATVEKAAKLAGVSRRLFYDLLDDWEKAAEQKIWSLVPYAARRETGRVKLDPAIGQELERLIRCSVARGGRLRGEVVAEVIASWPRGGLRRPALNTIRRHVDKVADDRLYQKGVLPELKTGNFDPRIKADRHGEVLVIDHLRLPLFGEQDLVPTPVTLTVAIDLHTATIAGFTPMIRLPSPRAVEAALVDAVRSTQSNKGESIKPRLVAAGTNAPKWQWMADALADAGIEANIRMGSHLPTGMFARRLIGPCIGRLPVSPRVTERDGDRRFNPRRHALVTLEELGVIVGDAVQMLNEQRADSAVTRNRIVFPDYLRVGWPD